MQQTELDVKDAREKIRREQSGHAAVLHTAPDYGHDDL